MEKKDMSNDKGVIVINYTGRKGGGVLDAYEMAKALVEQGQRVVAIISKDVENFYMWEKVAFEKLIPIKTYTNKMTFIINTLLFPLITKRRIRKECADMTIQAVYSPMVTQWTVKINKIFGKAKKIMVCHDPEPHSGSNMLNPLLIKDPYVGADIVIVHSKKFVEMIHKKYNRVKYIPLGRHNFYKNVTNKKTIVEYNPQQVNFIFFGRVEQYKGIDILGSAYERLSKEFGDLISLTIVGNGNFSIYKEQYAKLKNVKVINRWIKDEEVESVFLGDNIINVCPYKDATQSGVVLLAYDYGIPVIATATGGLVEQVQDEKTGLLIKPNDVESLYLAMKRFIEDREIYEKMQNEIQGFINGFNWENSAKQLVEIIQG